MREKVRVLYVSGSGRSGSTILGNILGQIEGFFSVGEVVYVWRRLVNDWTCSCGARLSECETWKPVLDEAFGGPEAIDARAMSRAQRTSTRPRHLLPMLAPRGRRLLASRWEEGYKDNLSRFYRAILNTTGGRIVVDSSKRPLYGYMLETMLEVELYVVHLVRDPRAVAYSWLRKKPNEPTTEKLAYMPRHHPVESSLEWNLCNVATEAFWRFLPQRYMMLRYEDFVRSPRKSVERILNLLGEDPASGLPFTSERDVRLGINHNIGGNPDRFQTGTVRLRPDAEWARRMRPRDRALVTLLTLPLLTRYGYPVAEDRRTSEAASGGRSGG